MTEHIAHRVVFPGANQVELEPFTLAAPAEDEVLVETICSLLSTGTETIVYARRFDAGTHWDKWVRYPFYPGYTSIGIVRAIGSAVGSLQIGQRVAFRIGHRSAALVKAALCYPVPEGVSSDAAVWFALAKIAGHGARAARLALGEPVAIIGAGPIGQMACRWALAGGAGAVAVVDVTESRLALAAAAGAIPVAASAVDGADAVVAALGGVRPRVVIDSTGNAAVLKGALGLVATEGTVVLLGDAGNPGSQTLTGDVVSRGLTLVGVHDARNSPEWNNPVAADRFFTFVRGGRFSLDGLITHRFAPGQCVEAYALASDGRAGTMGIVFDWNHGAEAASQKAAL